MFLPFYWIAAVGSILAAPVVLVIDRAEEWMWRGFGVRRLFRGRVRQGGWESGSGRFIIAVVVGASPTAACWP